MVIKRGQKPLNVGQLIYGNHMSTTRDIALHGAVSLKNQTQRVDGESGNKPYYEAAEEIFVKNDNLEGRVVGNEGRGNLRIGCRVIRSRIERIEYHCGFELVKVKESHRTYQCDIGCQRTLNRAGKGASIIKYAPNS